MRSKRDNWEDFLVWNHFKEVEQDKSSSKIRSCRKFSSNPKLQNEDLPAQKIPQDEHTQINFDDETILENVLESLRKKKSINTHEGPPK